MLFFALFRAFLELFLSRHFFSTYSALFTFTLLFSTYSLIFTYSNKPKESMHFMEGKQLATHGNQPKVKIVLTQLALHTVKGEPLANGHD